MFTISKIGDTDVVDVLGYDSIYLDTKDGALFQYRGVGTGSPAIQTKANLDAQSPLATDYPTLQYKYYKDANGDYIAYPR